MSETELSVVCKNCGSEVSPYVTECPYCGARIRKRAPKLERRGDGLEPKLGRRQRRASARRLKARSHADSESRPYATIAAIAGSAGLLLLLVASGSDFARYGGLIVPFETDTWRFFTASFAYSDVGYWFAIALALAIFGPPLERRLRTPLTALLLVGSGAVSMFVAYTVEDSRTYFGVIAGGNGVALAALAAWFVIRNSEARGAVDDDYDKLGAAVAGAALLLLPVFDSSANVFAGVAGAVVGALAGLAAATLRPAR